jgi:hypothetical protein
MLGIRSAPLLSAEQPGNQDATARGIMKANITARDHDGETALHCTAQHATPCYESLM